MQNTQSPVLLNCKSYGDDSNRDLVILHGLFGDLNNWKAIALRLSDQYQVHCMDLRNHGNSPHATGMTYHSMAADVAHTCSTLEITSTLVIGHSMGGKTAMQLALNTDTLVDRMAIVDIGPQLYQHHHNSIIEGLQVLASTALESRKRADTLLQDYEQDAGVRSFLLKNLQRSEDGAYKLRVNINEIAARYDDIADQIESAHPFSRPVLFIKGAESDYLTDESRDLIARLFSQPSLKTIGGAGHWPHSEKPDVIYKILADFFAAG